MTYEETIEAVRELSERAMLRPAPKRLRLNNGGILGRDLPVELRVRFEARRQFERGRENARVLCGSELVKQDGNGWWTRAGLQELRVEDRVYQKRELFTEVNPAMRDNEGRS
jgi:hypothetical protein